MKTITMFETVDELLDGFKRVRVYGDESVSIPDSVSLFVLSDGRMEFVGEESDKFLVPNLLYSDLVSRCLDLQNIRILPLEKVINEQK